MKRSHIIATVGGLLVLLIVWYFLLFAPQSKKLSNLQAKQSSLDTTQSQLTTKLASLKKAETHQRQRQQLLDSYTQQIPPTADLAGFINAVNGLASSTGVTLDSLSPTPPASAQGVSVSTISVSLVVTAPYASTVSFLQGLYNLPRLVVVDGLTIAQGGSAGGGGQPASSPSGTPTPGNPLQTTFKIRIFTTAAPPATPK